MKNLVISTSVRGFVAALIAGAATSAGASVIKDARLFYPGPVSPFPTIDYQTGTPNHPDYFHAALQRGACPTSAGYGLWTKSEVTYGTEQQAACLNLETGVVATISGTQHSQPDSNAQWVEIAPPAQGGDYFAYKHAVESIVWTLKIMSLTGATGYAQHALDAIAQLNVDALDPVSPNQGYGYVYRGKPMAVQVHYKTATTRQIEATYIVDGHALSSTSTTVAAGEDTATMELPIPADAPASDATQVSFRIYSEDGQTSLAQPVSQNLTAAKDYNRVSDIHVVEYADLHAGQPARIALAWQVDRPMKAVVRLIGPAPERKVYSEASIETASVADPANVSLTLNVPSDTASKDYYRLAVRLVPEGGTWDQGASTETSDDYITVK